MPSKILACILLTVTVAACGPATGPATGAATGPPAGPPAGASTQADDTPLEPPLIQNGEATLLCNISAKENGKQKLSIVKGTGLEFDVAVSPIVDGTVQTRGPERGGTYRFSSHLVAAGPGSLSGVGPVSITDMDTKVNVEMDRYQQPGGPGTELTFTADDIGQRGVYVEFLGHALAPDGARYAFRITLGAPGAGSKGSVMPDGDAQQAPIMSKMVVIQAPQTTVVTTTTITRVR